MYKAILGSIGFAVVALLSFPDTTNALPVLQRSNEPANIAQSSSEETPPKEERDEGAVSTGVANEIQQKRELLEERIADRKAAVVDKLTGRRAELCLQKEAKINAILDSRVSAAQRYLDTFTSIEARLVEFVESNNLVVDDANAFTIVLEQKRINAVAQIETASITDFECLSTDAAQPGKIVMEQVAAQKLALSEYRAAIKDFAEAIKASAATARATDSTAADQEEQAQ